MITTNRVGRYAVGLITTAMAIAPLLWIVSTSFKTQVDAASYPPRPIPEHPTLSNYAGLFESSAFGSAIATSTGIATLATAITILVAVPCAYGLVRLRPYGRRFLILMIALAQAVPVIVFLIPLYSLSIDTGLYDTVPLISLVVGGLLTPFATLTLAAFMRGVPIEVEESALVDGCTRMGVLWRIVLPMSRAPLAATAVIIALYAWNEFLVPVILGGVETVPLTVFVANFVTQKTIEWGPLTAAVTVILLPVVAIVIAAQRQLVAGLTAGAVKG